MEDIKFKLGEKVMYYEKLVNGFAINFGEIQEIKIGDYGVVYIVNNLIFYEKDLYSYEKHKDNSLSFVKDIMLNHKKEVM